MPAHSLIASLLGRDLGQRTREIVRVVLSGRWVEASAGAPRSRARPRGAR